MDTLLLEEKLSVLKKLEEVAQCPICLSLLRPPLWYCVNGHCICMACKGSFTTCPTCRGRNLKCDKNIILEDMLNCLPKQCQFDGCNVFKLEENLKLHESDCPFRKLSCRLRFCGWEGKANSLLQHLKNVHSDYVMFGEESSVKVINFKANVMRFNVSFANAYDCIFWFYSKTDLVKRKFKICFVCVPTTSGIVNNFYSTVIFSSKEQPDFRFQLTQKVFNEDIDSDSVFLSKTFLAIPLSETSHFIENDDFLWNYKIFRKNLT